MVLMDQIGRAEPGSIGFKSRSTKTLQSLKKFWVEPYIIYTFSEFKMSSFIRSPIEKTLQAATMCKTKDIYIGTSGELSCMCLIKDDRTCTHQFCLTQVEVKTHNRINNKEMYFP